MVEGQMGTTVVEEGAVVQEDPKGTIPIIKARGPNEKLTAHIQMNQTL